MNTVDPSRDEEMAVVTSTGEKVTVVRRHVDVTVDLSIVEENTVEHNRGEMNKVYPSRDEEMTVVFTPFLCTTDFLSRSAEMKR